VVGVRNCCCVMSSHTPYLGPGVATRKVRGAAVWQKWIASLKKGLLLWPCFVHSFWLVSLIWVDTTSYYDAHFWAKKFPQN